MMEFDYKKFSSDLKSGELKDSFAEIAELAGNTVATFTGKLQEANLPEKTVVHIVEHLAPYMLNYLIGLLMMNTYSSGGMMSSKKDAMAERMLKALDDKDFFAA